MVCIEYGAEVLSVVGRWYLLFFLVEEEEELCVTSTATLRDMYH